MEKNEIKDLNRLSKYVGRAFAWKFGGVIFTHKIKRLLYDADLGEFVFDDEVTSSFQNGEQLNEVRLSYAKDIESRILSRQYTEVYL